MTIILPTNLSTLEMNGLVWHIKTRFGTVLQGRSPDLTFNTSCNTELYVGRCENDCVLDT